jgi:hypothetical protein
VVEPAASRVVEDCLARIRQLEEENAQLREAATTFGALAERLKRALDAELRSTGQPGQPCQDGAVSLDILDAGPAGLAK